MIQPEEMKSPGVRIMIRLNKYAFPIYSVLRAVEEVKNKGIWANISNASIEQILSIPKSRVSATIKFMVDNKLVKRVGSEFQLGTIAQKRCYYFIYIDDKNFIHSYSERNDFPDNGYCKSNEFSLKSYVESNVEAETDENSGYAESNDSDHSDPFFLKKKNLRIRIKRKKESSLGREDTELKIVPKFESDYNAITRKELVDYFISYGDCSPKKYNAEILAGKFFHIFRRTRKHFPNLKPKLVIQELNRALGLFCQWFAEDLKENKLTAEEVMNVMIEIALDTKIGGREYLSVYSDLFCSRSFINKWGWYDKTMQKLLKPEKKKIVWRK